MHKQINNKHCPSCRLDVPIENFYKTANGYSSKCKPCTIAYNTEYRKNKVPRARPRRVSLGESNHRMIKNLGPGIEFLRGRYTHTYTEFALYLGPWGYIVDGELLYGEYSIDDVLHVLHIRHMKLISHVESDLKPEDIHSKILQVKNSCGVPIGVSFVKGLVSRPQYFLWMEEPRKLLLSEAAAQTQLTEEVINFILQEKSDSNRKSCSPEILKNSEHNMPQAIEYTYTEE